MALAALALEMLFFQGVLEALGETIDEPMVVYTDNQAAYDLCHRFSAGQHSRHVDRKMYKMRELRAEGKVDVRKIDGTKNPADMFTKPLARAELHEHRATVMNLAASGAPTREQHAAGLAARFKSLPPGLGLGGAPSPPPSPPPGMERPDVVLDVYVDDWVARLKSKAAPAKIKDRIVALGFAPYPPLDSYARADPRPPWRSIALAAALSLLGAAAWWYAVVTPGLSHSHIFDTGASVLAELAAYGEDALPPASTRAGGG